MPRMPAKIRRKDRFFIFFITRYLSVINPGEKVIIHLRISNRKNLARFVMRCSISLIDVYKRQGFSFSAGAMDLLFSSSLPAAQKTWLILPLGIAAFIVFYVVFLFAIKKFDLKTPGREDDDDLEAEKNIELANDDYTCLLYTSCTFIHEPET